MIFFPYTIVYKDSSTAQMVSTIPKTVIIFNILWNYISILSPFHANIGVYVTIYAIIDPIIMNIGPNNRTITICGHTIYKLITSLPINRGEFLYLLQCSIPLSGKTYTKAFINPMESSYDDPIITLFSEISASYLRNTCYIIWGEPGFLLMYSINDMKDVGHTNLNTILITTKIPNDIPITR